MNDYTEFINNKHFRQVEAGFDHVCTNARLFDYQNATVEWALRRGKALIAKDTGLGKTLDELEFGQAVADHTDAPVLLLAPLCVGHQIHREAGDFGYRTKLIRDMADVSGGINICNYELIHRLDFTRFSGIVLDEGSILKGIDGKIRRNLTEAAQTIPYRLSATATPAPNDFMEIGTQSEFLGIMTQVEMLATFFIHDGADTAKWRLKGHGRQKFFEWLATWAVIMRDPSDYGFQPKPALPALHIEQITVETEVTDGLFATVAQSLSERLNARRDTIEDRCRKASEIVAALDGPVLIWCGLNAEGDLLERLIPGAVQVAGSDTEEHKNAAIRWFCEDAWTKPISNGTTKRTASRGLKHQNNTVETTERKSSNICASTTGPTRIDSRELLSNKKELMPQEGSGTQKIESTEIRQSRTQSDFKKLTQKPDSISGCALTESLLMTTGRCWQSRAGSAQFAERMTPETSEQTDSTSITATQQESCEVCCVQHATEGLGCSRTASVRSDQPLNTSKKVLISKPRIFGYGMNLQHCNQQVFVGLSDSFEQYYQAVRRCWRHGQKRDVNVWIITADSEGAVVENIRRKQILADTMMGEMAKIASRFFQGFEKAGRELRAYQAAKTAPKPTFMRGV